MVSFATDRDDLCIAADRSACRIAEVERTNIHWEGQVSALRRRGAGSPERVRHEGAGCQRGNLATFRGVRFAPVRNWISRSLVLSFDGFRCGALGPALIPHSSKPSRSGELLRLGVHFSMRAEAPPINERKFV
jgi:hypothetical protein